jgi:AbrB family looped-hinge helix DNA binding protein
MRSRDFLRIREFNPIFRIESSIQFSRRLNPVASFRQGWFGRGWLTFDSLLGTFVSCVIKEDRVMASSARINQQGRIVIPAECRAAAGLKPGDELLIETVGEGELRLRTPEQAIKAAQAIVARRVPRDRDLVAELIAERRAEAERE